MTAGELFEFDSSPFALERDLFRLGYEWVAGVDEVGRGALAGPVVAAAVIFKSKHRGLAKRVQDSKKLTPEEREELYPIILENAECAGVGVVEPAEIDRINILRASLYAMRVAVESLKPQPHLCLIDGNARAPLDIPQRVIIKGDDRVFSIGAASIVAKVTRDRIMRDLDQKFPGYQFGVHKGYGTVTHQEAISRLGLCAIHRKSFSISVTIQE